jgi:hypothetical protein
MFELPPMKKNFIVFSILFVLLAASCSVDKRIHRNGYHITWHKNKRSSEGRVADASQIKAAENPADVKPDQLKAAMPEVLAAATGSEISLLSKPDVNKDLFAEGVSEECDVITMKNGDDIKVKVIEITPDLIKYKRCDFLDGPIYTARKSEVFMVRYANGTKEVFQQTPATTPANNQATSARPEKKKFLGFSIAAFIVSIVAFFSPLPLSLVLGVLALVFGIISVVKLKTRPEFKGKGLAIAAIIISAIVVLLSLALLALV